MSYENQLLFYKETLKHRNEKKIYVFTTKLQNFLHGLLQRGSMIHTVELHFLLFKSIPFSPIPLSSPSFYREKGKSRESHMIKILS